MDNIEELETQLRVPIAYTQAELNAKVKSHKAVSHRLIDAIQEANEILLNAAASSQEPDKILAASKVLVESLAEVAKA